MDENQHGLENSSTDPDKDYNRKTWCTYKDFLLYEEKKI